MDVRTMMYYIIVVRLVLRGSAMTRSSAVLQLRLDAKLKNDFAEAARAQNTTPSQAMRCLITDFVRENYRSEAKRQSRLVAAAPDYDETMDEIAHLSRWMHD